MRRIDLSPSYFRLLFNIPLKNIWFISRHRHYQRWDPIQYICPTIEVFEYCMIFLRHTCCDSLILEVTLKYYCSTVSYPFVNRSGDAMSKSVRPASGRLGVRIPVTRDLSRKDRQWQCHCQTLGIRCECHGSLEMTLYKQMPLVTADVAL